MPYCPNHCFWISKFIVIRTFWFTIFFFLCWKTTREGRRGKTFSVSEHQNQPMFRFATIPKDLTKRSDALKELRHRTRRVRCASRLTSDFFFYCWNCNYLKRAKCSDSCKFWYSKTCNWRYLQSWDLEVICILIS